MSSTTLLQIMKGFFFEVFGGMSLDTPGCTLPKQLHVRLHDDMPQGKLWEAQLNENCHTTQFMHKENTRVFLGGKKINIIYIYRQYIQYVYVYIHHECSLYTVF